MSYMRPEDLKTAQSNLGLTNKQLADTLGKNVATIERWRKSGAPKIAGLAIKYLLSRAAKC